MFIGIFFVYFNVIQFCSFLSQSIKIYSSLHKEIFSVWYITREKIRWRKLTWFFNDSFFFVAGTKREISEKVNDKLCLFLVFLVKINIEFYEKSKDWTWFEWIIGSSHCNAIFYFACQKPDLSESWKPLDIYAFVFEAIKFLKYSFYIRPKIYYHKMW